MPDSFQLFLPFSELCSTWATYETLKVLQDNQLTSLKRAKKTAFSASAKSDDFGPSIISSHFFNLLVRFYFLVFSVILVTLGGEVGGAERKI